MDTTLIIIGVGCIIGAIVGGGVRLAQLELSPVVSLWRQFLLGAFGLILVVSGLFVGGHIPNQTTGSTPIASDGDTNTSKSAISNREDAGPFDGATPNSNENKDASSLSSRRKDASTARSRVIDQEPSPPQSMDKNGIPVGREKPPQTECSKLIGAAVASSSSIMLYYNSNDYKLSEAAKAGVCRLVNYSRSSNKNMTITQESGPDEDDPDAIMSYRRQYVVKFLTENAVSRSAIEDKSDRNNFCPKGNRQGSDGCGSLTIEVN